MSANGTGSGAGESVDASAGESQAAQAGGANVSRLDTLSAFDLDGFIRSARETRGVIRLADLPRVLDLLPADAPAEARESALRWRAQGEIRKVLRRRGMGSSAAARAAAQNDAPDQPRGAFQATEPHLTVTIDGAVWLECQRCMQPFSWPVSVEAGYRVARDERQADVLAGDDAADDVIVGSPSFDLLDLIDEEIVLSLPMVPKHRVCPAVHASVVSGADGALGVDRVEDIDARLTEAAGEDPTPLPGERAVPKGADAAVDAVDKPARVSGTPTRKPFAAALAGWQPARTSDEKGKAAGGGDGAPKTPDSDKSDSEA